MIVVHKAYSAQSYEIRLLAEEEEHDFRLDQFVQAHLGSFSREEIKKRIGLGHMRIEGRDHKMKSSTKVKQGEVVFIEIPRTTQEDEYWRGEKLPLVERPEVVFEDDDLIVISKPPYMATHPTGKHIFNCATVYFESIHKKTIHSLHRLDRETSGLLMLSKNPKLAALITDQFERDLVKKAYFFIAKVALPNVPMQFEARERLGPKEDGLKRIHIHAFPEDSTLGKSASTSFHLLHLEDGYALGLAFPKTGRQHQIRVHAQTHGLPLIGDKIYLGSFKMFQRFKDGLATPEDHDLMELSRHALHATALVCDYRGEKKLFLSPLPHDFREWITQKMSLSPEQVEELVKHQIEKSDFVKN